MVRFLSVFLFESEDDYRQYKRAHDGSMENAPLALVSGTQGLDLGLYNAWKGSAHNLEAVFVGEVMRQLRTGERVLHFTLLSVLAAILAECQADAARYVVIRNM